MGTLQPAFFELCGRVRNGPGTESPSSSPRVGEKGASYFGRTLWIHTQGAILSPKLKNAQLSRGVFPHLLPAALGTTKRDDLKIYAHFFDNL